VQLRLIEPGQPNQNAYIESFNGRPRDECLNEHGIPNLLHARAEIERWHAYSARCRSKIPRHVGPVGEVGYPRHRGLCFF
jgi:transposase InsO family protein